MSTGNNVTTNVRLSDEALAGITSYEDAVRAINEAGGKIESAADYGNGFAVVEKETLIGIPLLLIEWRFNEGDNGDFVSVEALTKNGEKVVFNDGSTGLRDQLHLITTRREEAGVASPQMGLLCPTGLTAKTYKRKDETGALLYVDPSNKATGVTTVANGKPAMATTYRIAM